jgi:broad specificity phosphatase PhoE
LTYEFDHLLSATWETTASQTGGYCGTLDQDLTPAGYQMAEDFADAYKSLPWVAVFSSPLGRAVATAKPLCDAAGIRMQLREGLKEIAYGQWEGKTRASMKQLFCIFGKVVRSLSPL